MPLPSLPTHDQDATWALLSNLIARTLGLHFPPDRFADLKRGVARAAGELGFQDPRACVDWLLSTPPGRPQLEVLAHHLTVGETYFFRDRKAFDVLATRVLPELIRRRAPERRLRFWSAACCSGEEAYSLAIALHQVLPDLPSWNVTILATDVNTRFLRKARAGAYGEWSFRDAPRGLRERYFTKTSDGLSVIRQDIRKMVAFECVNLVDDAYPTLATETNAMDLVFCRNVLMYFTPAQTRKVAGKLQRALTAGGWLAVGPSETSQTLFPQCVAHSFPGVILYQKRETELHQPPWIPPDFGETRAPLTPAPGAPSPWMEPPTDAGSVAAAPVPPEPESFAGMTRALANEGRLAEALASCERWIASDKLNAGAYYVRAAVLIEHGQKEEAQRALRHALYLDPEFVLAHFVLGNLTSSRGADVEARRHFRNALRLLERLQPQDLLPESDGLTAARLTETITTIAGLDALP